MGIRGELYSEKLSVAEGKRTYFFNVKRNHNGDRFIVLAENVMKFDDRVDRQQIMIYEEHLDDFRYALGKAVSAMKTIAEDESRGKADTKKTNNTPEKRYNTEKQSGILGKNKSLSVNKSKRTSRVFGSPKTFHTVSHTPCADSQPSHKKTRQQ